ncbi:membrane fusion protein, multidrug efflux system [bacterium A37T11]|nr:membrane fusion protein, multidrug efflux system [bacterium A37T11]
MNEDIVQNPEIKVETHTEREEKRRKQIRIVNWISALVVLAAIIWGVLVFFHFNESVYTDDAQVDAYINPINSRIAGYIKEIRFTEHQAVHKGDTLAIIEDDEYKLHVQEALSALANAEASRIVTSSGVDVASNSVNVADANLEELRAQLQNLETNYRRYENLLKADVVSQYQFDEVKTQLDAMKAKYRALQAQHTTTKLTTEESRKKLPLNDAALESARAAVALAKLNLSYTIIRAPYDGVLGRKIIEEGQLIQPGQALVSIIRGNEKWITANYTESQMKSVNIGQEVNIKIDALRGKTFHGRITAISEATGSKYSAVPVDNSTGNFVKVQQRIPVRIDFDKQNNAEDLDRLRIGMNAIVNK